MKDFGKSDNPAVQTQLDRLSALSLPQGRIGLETIGRLMERLGNPHRKLPPVFHVAGTNGKGSTCAFLRAMLEAEGNSVHMTTSPHLVRYNERIRIAGELIEDNALAVLLEEVLDASENSGEALSPSFFEVTIAAAFLAFSRTPADACVVEVGLGGRFDATNVLEAEAVAASGIAALGIDHERFLLAPEDGVPTDPMARIAFEKAGIAKKGVPLVTMGALYPQQARAAIAETSLQSGASLFEFGADWAMKTASENNHAFYSEGNDTEIPIAELSLPGRHQALNAGLAIAMLRRQRALAISLQAIRAGAARAVWPARLQLLSDGPLTSGREVWLDGGHNPDAGQMLARHFAGRQMHLIIGMIEGKDPAALTGPLSPMLASVTAVPISTHASQVASAYSPDAVRASSVQDALAALPNDGLPVLIAGSLYLSGDVLRLNHEIPQ